jgi:hypothetical protein
MELRPNSEAPNVSPPKPCTDVLALCAAAVIGKPHMSTERINALHMIKDTPALA